ncbi:CX module [Dictyocaulus viviparus]|uniref:CX module n=1 Tax=Dictyocaulus viviparus TaxID=29172 RepID=A0A0D8XUL9_DICVI|nr:CX module [Dictyocaulus viviparus]
MSPYQMCVYALLICTVIGRKSRGGDSHSGRSYRTKTTTPRFIRKFSKIGSIERTSLFRSTVFGAATTYVTFKAGKHIINDPEKPIVFDSRAYYWNSDLQMPDETLPVQCVNKIDPQDPQFGRVYYANDSRPTEIAYGCADADYCCGYDCCQETTFFTSLFILLIMILVFSIVTVFCIQAFRWGINCMYICKYGHPREFHPLKI